MSIYSDKLRSTVTTLNLNDFKRWNDLYQPTAYYIQYIKH